MLPDFEGGSRCPLLLTMSRYSFHAPYIDPKSLNSHFFHRSLSLVQRPYAPERFREHVKPVLPQEVVEGIIDELCCDRDALKCSSLAAKHLLPRCRHHLHQHMCLKFPKRNSPSPPLAPLPDSIIQYIRKLELSDIDRVSATPNPALEPYFDVLRDLLTAPQVRDLSLDSIHRDYFSEDFKGYFSSLHHSLTSLSLTNFACGSTKDLFSFISEFRNLRSLAISNFLWALPHDTRDVEPFKEIKWRLGLLRLRQLDLNLLYSPAHIVEDFTLLMSSIAAETIIDFRYRCFGDGGLEWLPDILSRAIHLQHLCVSFRHGEGLRRLGLFI